MIAEVIARLQIRVPALRSVEGAATLAALIQSKAVPQQTPAAHVVPLGLQGSRPEDVSGAFIQSFDEIIGVVLFWRTDSQTGARTLPSVEDEIRAVCEALAGWAPPGAMGVFRLVRGGLISMATGTIIYQLDFAIQDQLRIAP